MDVQGITIDSATTRDRDDAICATLDTRGWTVTVCIANVAAAISAGSTFDETARRRVETSYLAGNRSRPMLPRRFSEGSCSLTDGQSRRVMAIRIRLDHSLETQFVSIDESHLVTGGQLTYGDIPRILESKDHHLHSTISSLGRVAEGLLEKRRKKGAFVLYDLMNGWVTTEEGHLRRIRDTKETFGYIIVQELMILANSELARFCVENEIPVPFRNHTARAAAPEREAMMERINLGLRGPIADLETARKQFAMVLNKANYGTTLGGHYGLNLPAYLHGTSPIRRYADLIVQRQVLAFVGSGKGKLPYSDEDVEQICDHINSALDARAKEVSQAALERANSQAEKSIRKDDLAHLSDKDFERVIKVAVRAKGFNPFVSEVFLNRLKEGTATLIDIHFILFNSTPGWRPIRKIIIKHLADNPHKAISVAAIAAQTNGWSEAKYHVQRGGEDHRIMHTVQVYFKKPGLQSSKVKTSSSKVAKQRAVVEVLAKFVDEEIPDWLAAEVAPEADVSIPSRDSDNHVGSLGEYCQAIGEEPPQYDTRRAGGPDHEPNFIVSCKVLDLSVESPALPSKKLAKRQAAMMVIKLLRAKANQ